MESVTNLGRVFLLSTAAALLTFGQGNDEDMHRWMESADKAMIVLKKLEQKTGADAVSAAERLGGVYENMIGFWRSRNSTEAAKWSEEGKAIAVQLTAAAHAGDVEQSAKLFKAFAATCKPCHDAHRERLPDGKYRIKQ